MTGNCHSLQSTERRRKALRSAEALLGIRKQMLTRGRAYVNSSIAGAAALTKHPLYTLRAGAIPCDCCVAVRLSRTVRGCRLEKHCRQVYRPSGRNILLTRPLNRFRDLRCSPSPSLSSLALLVLSLLEELSSDDTLMTPFTCFARALLGSVVAGVGGATDRS